MERIKEVLPVNILDTPKRLHRGAHRYRANYAQFGRKPVGECEYVGVAKAKGKCNPIAGLPCLRCNIFRLSDRFRVRQNLLMPFVVGAGAPSTLHPVYLAQVRPTRPHGRRCALNNGSIGRRCAHKALEHGVKNDLDVFQIDRPRVNISAQNRRDPAGDKHTQVTIAAPP